ncbi:MAG: SulP family inorganic anion transporter [Hyphomicrobiaceae bacterium]
MEHLSTRLLTKSSIFPPRDWVPEYRPGWLRRDLMAGLTLAAYAIPVSLAYATLAGLPPQVGVYGYLLGGLGYALAGSSRQLAIGPTSAISLMVAGTVGAMAAGDAQRYFEIASLTAFVVAVLCFFAWLFRLSALVNLISDSILVGFKAGAALTIAMTQIPSLLGITGGGHNFLERVFTVVGQLDQVDALVAATGISAIALLALGNRQFPGRPIALGVVILAIVSATLLQLPAFGVPVTGAIPSGLPSISLPSLRVRDVEGIFPLAAGCLLLAYIEGVSAARTFASKHGYEIDSRQEFLGVGMANLFASLGHGYPVAGGLSQTAVNDKAGARTPLALVFASAALALCLLFLTDQLENLPRAVLAAIVLTAILGLFDIPALVRMWRVSRFDFNAAAVALLAVLLLGILQGILLAAVASVAMLLFRASHPYVAFLGHVPGTNIHSDIARHPDNEPIPGVLAFRPAASLLYMNSDAVKTVVLARLDAEADRGISDVICDLSNAPAIDLAGSRMLHDLSQELETRNMKLSVIGAHGAVRELLLADGLAMKADVPEGA